MLGGHYQRVGFHKDERELFSAAQEALRGFDQGKGTQNERDAAHKMLAPNLETVLDLDKGSLATFGHIADALEQAKALTTALRENPMSARERAAQSLEQHARATASGGEGRGAWFDSFSYDLGGSLDAKRDAVHRFRQKDAERENAMSDRPRGGGGSAPAAPSTGTGTGTGTGQTASQSANAAPQPLRGAEMAARLNDAGMAAVKAQVQEAGRGLANAGTQYKGNVSQGDNVSPNTTPAQPQNQTTQRYQGRTLDGNDSPRMQPAPGRGASGSAGSAQGAGQATGQGAGQETAQRPSAPNTPGEQTRGSDMGARLGDGARPETKPATNTISQQNPATMQQGARDAGPKQSEQQHQGAAVGKGQEQTGAGGKEALNAYYDQHGGKSSEADKNISQQKQQTQEQGRDDR